VCEDQITEYMDGTTATRILTDKDLVLPTKSSREIKEAAKAVFLEEYERLRDIDSELEEKVFKVKGLMSELLTHKKKKSRTTRRRKNSIG
jgi:hypothetical protein